MGYHTVLFDLDGTLTDPAVGICTSVQYALEKAGRKPGPLEEYYRWIGPPLAYSFEVYAGATPEEAGQMVAFYRERYSTVGLFENRIPRYPGASGPAEESRAPPGRWPPESPRAFPSGFWTGSGWLVILTVYPVPPCRTALRTNATSFAMLCMSWAYGIWTAASWLATGPRCGRGQDERGGFYRRALWIRQPGGAGGGRR